VKRLRTTSAQSNSVSNRYTAEYERAFAENEKRNTAKGEKV
jgi:hypothetical protein